MESDPKSFYWYDLETSGTDAAHDRIVQFAGLRTNADLEPVEDPFVTYVRLEPEVLPNVESCLVTGITPQQTLREGISEWEALTEINRRFSEPGTCVAGYNNLRFDDDFIRHGLYRNLMDPYAREWRDGNSRWDVIDLVRAAGGLRPAGVVWPVDDEKPVFNLEAMAAANGLLHENAHDALSDVEATVALARLVKRAQPRLWAFALAHRGRGAARRWLFPLGASISVHVSRMYPNSRYCLAPVMSVAVHPRIDQRVIVVDLTCDVSLLLDGTPEEIRLALFTPAAEGESAPARPPLKQVVLNRCPFVAPIGVLRPDDAARLGIDMAKVERAHAKLAESKDLAERIAAVYDSERSFEPAPYAELALYEGFVGDADRRKCEALQAALVGGDPWPSFDVDDRRVRDLAERLKARLRPQELTTPERAGFLDFVRDRLLSDRGLDRFRENIERTAMTLGSNDVLEALMEHALNLEAMLREEARI